MLSHPQEKRKNIVLLFSFLLFCAVGNLKLIDHVEVLSLCACWTGQESTAITRNSGPLTRARGLGGRCEKPGAGGAGLPTCAVSRTAWLGSAGPVGPVGFSVACPV